MLKRLYAVFALCAVVLLTAACKDGLVKEHVETLSGPAGVIEPELESEQVSEPVSEPMPEQSSEPTPAAIDYEAVRPYEVGQIMIIMYHGVEKEVANGNSYDRTVEDFKNDLAELYARGFRAISLKDLADNNITTEAGYTPVVITFDDGRPSSFSLVNQNGMLVPAPDCGLDILMKFNEQHPDFGMAATFYVNGNNDPFRGAGTIKERFEYLTANGCDIGNHTYSHAYLDKLDAEGIMREIGEADAMIKAALPGYEPIGVSYPFGIRPLGDFKELVLSGQYNGGEYRYTFALREGMSGAASSPNRTGYDVLNMPRVRGSDDSETDLWDRLRFYEENPEYRYISDGDPDKIAVPKEYEGNVNLDSLGEKQLFIYGN